MKRDIHHHAAHLAIKKAWLFLAILLVFSCKSSDSRDASLTTGTAGNNAGEAQNTPAYTTKGNIIEDDENEGSEDFQNGGDDQGEPDENIEANRVKDGEYSATVEYDNPGTNYSSTYTLDVEVEDGKVIRVNFPNDCYLDNSHITPGELDDNGDVTIYGEQGKTYTIHIDL